MLCKQCTSDQCRDKGTDFEPIHIVCPTCAGRGCKQCTGGMFEVKGCPNRYCESVIPFVRLADWLDRGMLPVSGGVLDQSASFLDACRVLKAQEAIVANG